MEKYVGSVYVDTDNSRIFKADDRTEIKCPYDIVKAYEIMCTFEYIKENYNGYTDEDLWDKAIDIRRRMDKYDLNEDTAIYEVLGSY